MAFKKIKAQNYTEEELRDIWRKTYCDPNHPIYTFDNIQVKFYEDMFDHAFFESASRRRGDKSILSLNRCQKIYWIKDTLESPDAILKQGWNKKTKSYTKTRRVAIVKDNYIVVIRFVTEKVAKFLTAYEMNDDQNLQKVLNGPDWK